LRFDAYDTHRALVIDPQVVYTTSFGATVNLVSGTVRTDLDNYVSGAAVESAGNLYIAGTAYKVAGSSVPLVNPVQGTCPRVHCAFVTKLSPDGKTILYSTFAVRCPGGTSLQRSA
jgi:hypothetical protein